MGVRGGGGVGVKDIWVLGLGLRVLGFWVRLRAFDRDHSTYRIQGW